MQTVIFDDDALSNFYPLTLNRSIGDLRCGITKLRQHLESIFSDSEETCVLIAENLVPLYQERHPDWIINSAVRGEKLYLNSRIIITADAVEQIQKLDFGSCLYTGQNIVAIKVKDTSIFPDVAKLKKKLCNIKLYNCLADIIQDNSRMLMRDYHLHFYDGENYFETEPGVTVLHPYNVWVGEGAEFSPGVILDASEGPVVIDTGAYIMANAVLCGPVYLGKKSLVKIGAKIYGGTSIGPVCKVGGEVEGTIFQGYSNKQHDGFLGHSYIGEWVNIGADTNNSDLKNTYKTVAYYSYTHKAKIDSGNQFLGCVIGDHSKTGINCSINTGTVIGIGCNLYGPNLIRDFIPDFSWGEAEKLEKYRFPEFCETAEIVKQRRNLSFTATEKELYKNIYNMRI